MPFYVWIIIGFIAGILISWLLSAIKKATGELIIDCSNPNDIFLKKLSLDTDCERLSKTKRIVLKVIKN